MIGGVEMNDVRGMTNDFNDEERKIQVKGTSLPYR